MILFCPCQRHSTNDFVHNNCTVARNVLLKRYLLFVWKSLGMKMCVGGKQKKEREHQYYCTAAECTVPQKEKKNP